MSPFELLLAVVASACSGTAMFLFASSGYVPIWRWLVSGAENDAVKYQSWVDELFIDWSPQQTRRIAITARISIVAVALVALALLGSPVFAAALALLTYWL